MGDARILDKRIHPELGLVYEVPECTEMHDADTLRIFWLTGLNEDLKPTGHGHGAWATDTEDTDSEFSFALVRHGFEGLSADSHTAGINITQLVAMVQILLEQIHADPSIPKPDSQPALLAAAEGFILGLGVFRTDDEEFDGHAVMTGVDLIDIVSTIGSLRMDIDTRTIEDLVNDPNAMAWVDLMNGGEEE